MTYQERLIEIITEHAKEVLRVEADPFGKNVDWVKAGNRALAAINTLNAEMIGNVPRDLHNFDGVPLGLYAGRADLRKRFGIEEAV